MALIYLFLLSFEVKFSKNGFTKSMGKGNRIVEFFSTATSVNVCKYLSCKEEGCLAIFRAASTSLVSKAVILIL
jgi:hypothetical protein